MVSLHHLPPLISGSQNHTAPHVLVLKKAEKLGRPFSHLLIQHSLFLQRQLYSLIFDFMGAFLGLICSFCVEGSNKGKLVPARCLRWEALSQIPNLAVLHYKVGGLLKI